MEPSVEEILTICSMVPSLYKMSTMSLYGKKNNNNKIFLSPESRKFEAESLDIASGTRSIKFDQMMILG